MDELETNGQHLLGLSSQFPPPYNWFCRPLRRSSKICRRSRWLVPSLFRVIACMWWFYYLPLAVSQQFQGIELKCCPCWSNFLLTIWFVSRIFFILPYEPNIFDGWDDVSISCTCLMMVILASNVGFSPLPDFCFIMGSIVKLHKLNMFQSNL
jgi:hypothetical protein